MALAASFSPTAMRSGTKGLKIAKLNMGLWDDLQKAFTQQVGGSTIPAPSGSSGSSVSRKETSNEPGRYPPKLTVPPTPKRKMVLTDLKSSDLKGKRVLVRCDLNVPIIRVLGVDIKPPLSLSSPSSLLAYFKVGFT